MRAPVLSVQSAASARRSWAERRCIEVSHDDRAIIFQGGRMTTVEIACIVCGTSFATTRSSRGRLPRFCSTVCRHKRRAKQHQQYRDEGRYPPPRRRPIAKTCVICKQAFETTNRETVCCGLECGFQLSHRLSAATRTARRIERDARICQHCGLGFVARNASGKARRGQSREGQFCSRRCAASAVTTRPGRQLSLFGPSLNGQAKGGHG